VQKRDDGFSFQTCATKEMQKNGSFSLIERVILSAGAMLIFSVSFQIDQMSEDKSKAKMLVYIDRKIDTTPQK
jgi:hypothetical protein